MDNLRLVRGIILIVVATIAFYLIIPKYEYYQSGDGTSQFRFNKITGTLEWNRSGKWIEDTAGPLSFIKRP